MGETREGLGEMADPADLVTALVQLGLLERAFTGTELAAETDRAGGADSGLRTAGLPPPARSDLGRVLAAIRISRWS